MTSLADDLGSSLAGECFKRAASAANLAAVICDSEGYPLSELQSIAVTQAFMECFDGLAANLADHLSVDAGLRTGRLDWLLGTGL